MENQYVRAFDKLVRRSLVDEQPTRRVTFGYDEVMSPDALLDRLTLEFGTEQCPTDARDLLTSSITDHISIAEAVARYRGRMQAKDIRHCEVSEAERLEALDYLATAWKNMQAVPLRVQIRSSLFPTADFLARFEDDTTRVTGDAVAILKLTSPASVGMGVKALRRVIAVGA